MLHSRLLSFSTSITHNDLPNRASNGDQQPCISHSLLRIRQLRLPTFYPSNNGIPLSTLTPYYSHPLTITNSLPKVRLSHHSHRPHNPHIPHLDPTYPPHHHPSSPSLRLIRRLQPRTFQARHRRRPCRHHRSHNLPSTRRRTAIR